MDGANLTSKYFGTLLVAYACNKQNHIFPIPFAIVDQRTRIVGLVPCSDAGRDN